MRWAATDFLGDENGLFQNQTTDELPPGPVKAAQAYEVRFVKHWIEGEMAWMYDDFGLIASEFHAGKGVLVIQSAKFGYHA